MAGRASIPMQPGGVVGRKSATREGGAALPRPVVITLGIAALWVALVMALQFAAAHAFGMVAGDGWAFAIGIVSYMYGFAGLVIGLFFALRAEERAGGVP